LKKIGILTSGGDCSGMNAAIRSVVRTGLNCGVQVIGFRKGFQGLITADHMIMDTRSVAGILQRGGTILHSARCAEFKTDEGLKAALENLAGLGVEGLVIIGGDGSLKGAMALDRLGFPVIGIPASIDNDIPLTDMALGVDTAMNNIVYAVDCIKDTASSHERAFVVEVMGRNCGYLASMSAIAVGAEFALVPEAPFDISEICDRLRARYAEGRSNAIIIVAEGAAKAGEIADKIKDTIGFETRITVLGHYQRGGGPSVFDRLLGSRFGKRAVEILISGQGGKMVALSGNSIISVPFAEVFSGVKTPDAEMLRMAEVLGT
jgi:6-phosphofructokinase 1